MQYELWARRRENKDYEFIQSFQDKNKSFSLIDSLDSSLYCEAIILLTDWMKESKCVMYKEFTKGKVLVRRK